MDIISFGKARQAEQKAESVQEQLNQAVAKGDQLAETQQARVDIDGKAHTTLDARINAEVQKLRQKDNDIAAQVSNTAAQLAETVKKGELIINVKDFGAKGDGTTDDTSAIQAAINSAKNKYSYEAEKTGAVVYFPIGVYPISTTLELGSNSGVSLLGDGKTKSNIVKKSGSTLTKLINVNGNNYRGELKGLRLAGKIGQLVDRGINIEGSGNQIYIEDCWFNNLEYGVYANPVADCNIKNNTFEYVQTPICFKSSYDCLVTDNMFYNCGPVSQGSGIKNPCYSFIDCKRIQVKNNRFISDAPMSDQQNGIILIQTCDSILFDGNMDYETTSQIGRKIRIISSTKVNILNNVFGKHLYETIKVEGAGTTDILIQGNQFSGGKTGAESFATIFATGSFTGISVINNHFKINSNSNNLVMDTGKEVLIEGNRFDKGYSVDAGVGRAIIHGNINGSTKNYLNAPPIYGSWKKGDLVYFSSPSAGGYIGAVCTADGTPGTWKKFGAIEA